MSEGSLVSAAFGRQGQALADRYVLGEVLGRGGMADVYQATDRLLERQVAVKILREPGLAKDDRERFLAEARTLAALNHPALVTLLDVYAGDDCTFLVMELVEGSSLAELNRTQPSTPQRAREIGMQLSDALAYVHAKGVVHRDLKPANVLIDDGDRVHLADFGIARVVGELTRHTATGFTVGTAAYVAPEQLLDRDISGAADIYALGLVLMECLSGSPAFRGTPVEVSAARLTTPPALPDSLTSEWRSLLSDMTVIDPTERPTASEVRERLASMATSGGGLDAATKVLNVNDTRPLTAPMPVVEQPAPEQGIAHELDGDTRPDRWTKVARHYVTTWTEFSPRTQLISVAVLAVLALVCIAIVINSAGDGTVRRDPAPDVPGQIGKDLESLHDAVYP